MTAIFKAVERERNNFREFSTKSCSSCKFLQEQETTDRGDYMTSFTCERGMVTLADKWRETLPPNDTRDEQCWEKDYHICDLWEQREQPSWQ